MMTLGDSYSVFYLPDNLKTLDVAGAAPSRQGKKCYLYRVSHVILPDESCDRP
jgi:hypothetical protein